MYRRRESRLIRHCPCRQPAGRILAVEDGALAAMLEERAEAMEREVAQKDAALRKRLETEP